MLLFERSQFLWMKKMKSKEKESRQAQLHGAFHQTLTSELAGIFHGPLMQAGVRPSACSHTLSLFCYGQRYVQLQLLLLRDHLCTSSGPVPPLCLWSTSSSSWHPGSSMICANQALCWYFTLPSFCLLLNDKLSPWLTPKHISGIYIFPQAAAFA